MINNINRIGKFTSSNIYKLMTNGKGAHGFGIPAITYINEVKLENKLGRSLETDSYSKAMAWGNFLEKRVFNLLEFERVFEGIEFDYVLDSHTSTVHPNINYWSGSADLITKSKEKIGEIKCYQPKNFAEYSEVLNSKDIELFKKEFPKEYWQLVSNSIIHNTPKAEAIVYMPYQEELTVIREMVESYDKPDIWKYRFIVESPDSALAYLPQDSKYKNLNRFEFEVNEEDAEYLTERILLAGKIINNG